MKYLFLILILFFNSCSIDNNEIPSEKIIADSINNNVPLGITINFSNFSNTLQCGWDKGASDGIDHEFGEFLLPPLPPFPVSDFRFISNMIPNGSLKDIRAYERKDLIGTFNLKCQFNDSVRLIVKFSDIRLEATLKDAITGNIVNIPLNAFQREKILLTNSAINNYIIILTYRQR